MFKIMTLKRKNRYDIESYTRKTHYRRAHTDAKIFHAVTWLDVKSITHTDELYSLHIDEYIGYSCRETHGVSLLAIQVLLNSR